MIAHPRFRAAYDFLLLRAAVGEVDQELADWWTMAQNDPSTPAPGSGASAPGKPRKRRRGGRRRSESA
jgi:poly(A) polymerase